MKMRNLVAVVITTLLTVTHSLYAQGTAFTYQGHVFDNGTNFTGAGLFKFALVTSTNTATRATATASLTGQFVTSYNLISDGSGYVTAPGVTITGGGGAGASASTTISGGVVTSINPVMAGSGYTSTPTVTIDPPPPNLAYTTFWSNDGTSVNGSQPAAAVSVGLTNGLFTVAIGDATLPNMLAIPAAVFTVTNLQLRLWFSDGANGCPALRPVQPLKPVPYAILAETATSLAGTLPAGQLSGTLGNSQLANSSITVNAGTGLSGGGTGALGGSLTLNATGSGGVVSVTGNADITATTVSGAVTLGDTATSLNTVGTLVKRDGSGNFSAGTISAASFTGNNPPTLYPPINANIGDVVQITGEGAGGWTASEYNPSLWTQTGAPSEGWQSIASSADGTHLVAAAGGFLGPNNIYTSTNSGATWAQTGAPAKEWQSVASSSDGTHLVAVIYYLYGPIYTSANSGATWTQTAPSQDWTAVASSSDGSHLVAVANNLATSDLDPAAFTPRPTPGRIGLRQELPAKSGRLWPRRPTAPIWSRWCPAAAFTPRRTPGRIGRCREHPAQTGNPWRPRPTARIWSRWCPAAAFTPRRTPGRIGRCREHPAQTGNPWRPRPTARIWSRWCPAAAFTPRRTPGRIGRCREHPAQTGNPWRPRPTARIWSRWCPAAAFTPRRTPERIGYRLEHPPNTGIPWRPRQMAPVWSWCATASTPRRTQERLGRRLEHPAQTGSPWPPRPTALIWPRWFITAAFTQTAAMLPLPVEFKAASPHCNTLATASGRRSHLPSSMERT